VTQTQRNHLVDFHSIERSAGDHSLSRPSSNCRNHHQTYCWFIGLPRDLQARPVPTELLMGLEPMTSSLPRKCSTTELQQHFRIHPSKPANQSWKAGEGNRTLVFSLEGCCSTIELHPHHQR
jgi:hypothetical protein